MKWSISKLIHFRNVLAVFVMSFVFLCSANAQTGTTSVHGVVSDKSGAVIAAANVTLANPAQGFQRSVSSNESGEYEFLALQPGTYSVVVEASGFRKFEQKTVQLLVNLPTTLNVTLEIGSSTQTVEVSGTAQTINTIDASLGNAFNENQVKQLPLEGRNVPDLLSLQPGVAYTGNRSDVPTFDTRSGAVNGAQRSEQRDRRWHRSERRRRESVHVGSARYVGLRAGIPRHDDELQCRSGKLFRRPGCACDEERNEHLSWIDLRIHP